MALEKTLDVCGQALCDGANIVGGYLWFQALTTTNVLALKGADRLTQGLPVREVPYGFEDREGDRIECTQEIGGLVSVAQDMTALIGACMYAGGAEGRYASIAAGIVGAKLVTNAVSYGLWRLFNRKNNMSEE